MRIIVVMGIALAVVGCAQQQPPPPVVAVAPPPAAIVPVVVQAPPPQPKIVTAALPAPKPAVVAPAPVPPGVAKASEPPPVASKALVPIRAALTGICDCPYDRAKNGSICGGRSAYSRPGGRSPICYR